MPIVINDNFEYADITEQIETLVRSPLINVGSIIDGSVKYNFQRNTSDKVSYGYTDDIYLTQFSLRNEGKSKQTVFLRDHTAQFIDFYLIHKNKLIYSFNWALAKGDLPNGKSNRFPLFPIEIEAGQTFRVLLQYQSKIPLIIKPELLNAKKTQQVLNFDKTFYFSFFGIFIILFSVYFTLSLLKQNLILAAYSLFLLGTILFNVLLLGFTYTINISFPTDLYGRIICVFIIIALMASMKYLCLLLNIKKSFPPFYEILKMFNIFMVFSLFPLFLLDVFVAQQLILVNLGLGAVLILIILFVASLKKQPYSSVMIIVSLYSLAVLTLLFAWMGVIRYSNNYFYILNTISLVEVIWFTVLINSKIFQRTIFGKKKRVNNAEE